MPSLFTCLLGCFIFILLGWSTQAQTPTPQCGTSGFSVEQARLMVQQANLAKARNRAARQTFTGITYVPIRPHIVRQSNGTGGFSLANLNQVLAQTNQHFLHSGVGIQFYFAGTSPDYIDSNELYTGFTETDELNSRDAPNALNQYYVSALAPTRTFGGIGGYAYYPTNTVQSTRSVLVTAYLKYLGKVTIPHELGHTFGLFHTFGPNTISNELVTRGNGANCTTEGDLICDTPADPRNRNGVSTFFIDGCEQYDPNSTVRDANGEPYAPSMTNMMGYWAPCTYEFTAGQYDRIEAGLALRKTHTAYSLDASPSAVSAPNNLVTMIRGSSVVLNWQDNADNEMGYFIERSTNPNAAFVSIGGVAPNQTTFIDNQVSVRTRYYYRIRPSNTTTGSLSSVTDVLVPDLTTVVTDLSAQLNWAASPNGGTYEVQWRVTNTANWTTIAGISTNTISLTGLSSNTSYEWRVRPTDSNTFDGPARFETAPCQIPADLFTSVTPTTAYIRWTPARSDQTFAFRWRSTGTTVWETVSNLATTDYSLTGLRSSTDYEWQVQAACSPALRSEFTPIQPFTTSPCRSPTNLRQDPPLATSATLFWSASYQSNSQIKLRYRQTGTADWTVVAGITSAFYSLTGLSNNTTYEWQVQTVCSELDQSSLSAISTFTTICRIPQLTTVQVTATTARLGWFVSGNAEPNSTYDLQYRKVGAADWTTVSGLTTRLYSLTGLPTNETYEYRVRLQCTPSVQSDFSASAPFTTRCNTPTNFSAGNVTSSSAQFTWSGENDASTTYDLRYRIAGSADWTTINGLTVSAYNYGIYLLTGLSNNNTYEWQIRANCAAASTSDYLPGTSFTTQCQSPVYVNAESVTVSSARLTWALTGKDVQYDVRYRRTGNPDWTQVNDLIDYPTLSGLASGASYEWQVRTHCNDGQYSEYSTPVTFTTFQCTAPNSVGSSTLTESTATIGWTYSYRSTDTRMEIRYRPAGTTNWTTITNIVYAGTSGSYSLTGLANSTQYEYQLKALCSASASSDFSTSFTFQTKAACMQMYTITPGSWAETRTWSCGRAPIATDIVHLKHTVTLPANYKATIRGLIYDVPVQLRFSTGSTVQFSQ
ncbi:fibronectin type III domain-containing protein [uncultured Spirosoma sp.]|uniref:fibronectin type III domain-containing protein n=1 Tax=uncultured Spirosoma sp. TaxID=278208 RepID=UPI002587742A|nr:fibronectin type III domain-containing protein [uncultured Spirosoma sp.]